MASSKRRYSRRLNGESFKELFGEISKKNAEIIENDFPLERLKDEFGLQTREALFAKAYAMTFNVPKSAEFAGYSKETIRKYSYRLLRRDDINLAINSMVEAVSAFTFRYRVNFMNKCVQKLLDIIDNSDGSPAVAAIESLRRFVEDPPIKFEHRKVAEQKTINDEDVEKSLKRLGVI